MFLDIHEVDDEEGRWARLNHELAGRGVPDLEGAILDLYLGDLYAPLAEIFEAEKMEALCASLVRGSGDALAESLWAPVLAFIAAAGKHAAGSGLEPESPGTGAKPLTAEQIWECFAAFLARLVLLAPPAPPAGTSPWPLSQPPHAAAALVYGLFSLLAPILGRNVSGVKAAALADHFKLDRKCLAALTALGMDWGRARRTLDLIQIILGRTEPAALAKTRTAPGQTAAALARSLLLENYDDCDLRRILGVNVFNDITWFNKEAFEEALSLGSLLFSLGPAAETAPDEPAWRRGLALVEETAALLAEAAIASGCRLDHLIDALSGAQTGGPGSKSGGVKAGKKKRS